ncbi:acyl-CoA dehydrogenase family protein [Lactobacillus sp. HT06-2]|uniref:acyl-CoA dehydrogenase family protein n=1 Tax=Lactobacillus sp. HT06-2 TaxID=2080222 RepID=UPI000CD9EEB2|nr:acyl-CoA dehydrogenase family protein [Lactobacillus sp. HT06-2]
MKWYLNDERIEWQKKAKKFAQEKIKPIVNRLENEETTITKAYQKAGSEGFMKLPLTKEEGGFEDFIS